MAAPDLIWQNLSKRAWLVHSFGDSDQSADQTNQSQIWANQVRDLQQHFPSTLPSPDTHPPLLLLCDPHPPTFLATFLAALLSGWNIAVANPHWSAQEWHSIIQRLNPDRIWGHNPDMPTHDLAGSNDSAPSIWKPFTSEPILSAPATSKTTISEPTILIPTGGSSGDIKFARHSWSSLMAAVGGFCSYFAPNGEPINAYCVLPLHHVSGLMQILRAWVSGGQVAMSTFKQLEHHSPLVTKPHDWYISLVPTQLERLMQSGKSDWLQQFQAVLIGGAPPWPTLLHRAESLPLWLSYGMTETAAMVTVTDAQAVASKIPGGVPNRIPSSGRALPHATLQIKQGDRICQPNEIGQIAIASAAVAQGYDDHSFSGAPSTFDLKANPAEKCFYTDDLGYLSADGQLYITGRASGKIISGGENIFPAEVEAALRSTGQVQDVCVLGSPHPIWGEAVIAAYVPAHAQVTPESLQRAIAPTLSRYKQPKQWISLSELPRNAQGKINRQQLLSQIAQSSPPVQA